MRAQARRRRRADPPPPRPRYRALADEASWDEFTGTELSHALAGTRWAADLMLDLARTLTAKLPGT